MYPEWRPWVQLYFPQSCHSPTQPSCHRFKDGSTLTSTAWLYKRRVIGAPPLQRLKSKSPCLQCPLFLLWDGTLVNQVHRGHKAKSDRVNLEKEIHVGGAFWEQGHAVLHQGRSDVLMSETANLKVSIRIMTLIRFVKVITWVTAAVCWVSIQVKRFTSQV